MPHPWHDIPNNVGDGDSPSFHVVTEIAKGGKLKYELDKPSGMLRVDRPLFSSVVYPANYGFLPRSYCEDGDPLDVLVLTPYPLLSGSVVAARPIGVLRMADEAGDDAKILAVPLDRLTTEYREVVSPETVPGQLIARIEHFFAHYKDLEPGKWVRLDGWGDADAAREIVIGSLARFRDHQ